MKPLVLFCLMLALFPAITSVVHWFQGEPLSGWEGLGVAVFPGLAWVWLRYFSVLGCRGECQPPDPPPPGK
ncbi:MAG: hypothetical protein HZB71_07045 [Betaproteobacteria bacterium]|nr:hypothetical protein [Betaproteobacteria bacterium]